LGFSDRIRYQISLAQDLPFTNEPDLADFVADTAVLEDTRGEKKAPAKRKEKMPPEFRKQFKVESKEEKPLKAPPGDEVIIQPSYTPTNTPIGQPSATLPVRFIY